MKLFTKICLIVAAIALGVGLLGVGIGFAMGADWKDLEQVGVYISPNQTVAVSGIAMEVMDEIELFDELDEFEESYHVYEDKDLGHHKNEVTHSFTPREENILHSYSNVTQDIRRLEVDVQNAEIMIFSTNEEQLRFDSNRKDEIGRVEGKTLKLEEESYFDEILQLEIYIPEGMLEEIDIEAVAGTVTADKLIADRVSVEVDGAVVQIEELIVTKEAELSVEAGNIMVGYYEGPNIDVSCDIGNIMVVCEGNEFDYNYKMECGLGRIVYAGESYSLVGENIHTYNDKSKWIHAECEVGEIVIEFPNSL